MVITSSPADIQKLRTPWLSTWGQAVLLLLITIGAYSQTWVDVLPYWDIENDFYAHGSLVALVAVWLLWRTQSKLNAIEPKPSARALLITLLLSGVWLLAERANLFIVYATLWPLLAFATLWAGLGMQAAARFAFPLSFLYFAIPIWDYLRPPLQAIAAAMVGFFTRIVGIPATLDGPYVTLPTGKLFIAQDCSGAHFLCIALAVGVLAGVLRRDDLRTRILTFIFAGVLSMAFNWLRILLIIFANLHPDLKDGLDTIGHVAFGWWVFALDLIVFSLLLRLVPLSANKHAESRPPDLTTRSRWDNRVGLSIAIIAALILPTIAWVLPRFDTYPAEMPSADIRISTAATHLISPDLYWSPHYSGTDSEHRFAVQIDDHITVEVYANQYHNQTNGSELISSVSHLFDPLFFSPSSSSITYLQDSKGQTISARRDVLTDNVGRSWLTLYTYLVESEPIIGSHHVQLKTALRSMYSRTTAGVVAVATPCVEKCDSQVLEVERTFIRVLEGYRKVRSE